MGTMAVMATGRRGGWVTLLTAALVMFLLGAIYAYGVVLPVLMAAFGWPRATAALPHAILLFVYAVGMAVGGVVQDRGSPTGGVMLGGALFGGGLLLASTNGSLLGLVAGYGVIGGIGFGFAYVAAVTAAMRTFPARRGLAAGVVVGAFGLGAFVWAPLTQHVLPALGWTGVFRQYGGLCLLLIPLLGFGVRAPRAAAHATNVAGVTLGAALRSPLFWTLFAAYTLVTAVGLLLLAHLVNYGLGRGMPAAAAAWLLSASAIGSGSGRFVMGWASDRLGRLPCLIGASAAEVGLLLLLTRADHPVALFLLAGATGFVFGTWLSLYGPTATDLFGLRAAGTIYGTLYLSYGIGGLAGPILGGAMADAGGYGRAFLVSAVIATLGTLLFILAARQRPPYYPHPPALDEELPPGE
jgi:OFA family oxalate/formate antiporter-like MFS transporter